MVALCVCLSPILLWYESTQFGCLSVYVCVCVIKLHLNEECMLLETLNQHSAAGHYFTIQSAGEYLHQPFGNFQCPASVLPFSVTDEQHIRIM